MGTKDKYEETLDSHAGGKGKKGMTNGGKNNRDKKFIFNRSNYVYLIAGILLNVIGFLLMIGGAAENPNEFDASSLFSDMRITVSPILILLGYAVIIYSIMKKPKALKATAEDEKQ